LVGEYRTTFAWVALIWHMSTLVVVLYLVVRYGNPEGFRGLFQELIRAAHRAKHRHNLAREEDHQREQAPGICVSD
jgi:hypothetical protein